MQALVLQEKESIAVMDVPRPVLTDGQALIQVSHCGICGSDVRYYYGDNPWAKQTLGKHLPNPPNIILGHEFTGIVDDVFNKKDAALIGKRVGVNTFITCGHCAYCRSGRENLCDATRHLGHGAGWGKMEFYPGGMAELCPAFANQIYELPAHVTNEQAVFLDPLITALHVVDTAQLQPADRVVILGAGPIGLLIAQVARQAGAAWIGITDISDNNINIARQTGADAAWNIARQSADIVALVMHETDNFGVDVVCNTVGTSDSISDAMAMLAKSGRQILLATKDDNIQFPAHLITGERTLKTSSNALYSDFPLAIAMVAESKVQVEPLITHRYTLTDALQAFDTACNKDTTGAIKVIVECQA
jgi:threonine dehydrogenase-like Zn-dependent dehydrogenase